MCEVLRENVKESVILSLRAYEICVDFQHFLSGFYEILQRQFSQKLNGIVCISCQSVH